VVSFESAEKDGIDLTAAKFDLVLGFARIF